MLTFILIVLKWHERKEKERQERDRFEVRSSLCKVGL